MKIVFILSLLAFASSLQWRIDTGINEILRQPQLFALSSNELPTPDANRALSTSVGAIFSKLILALPSQHRSFFKLRYFDGNAVFINLSSQTIYLNPGFEKSLKEIVPAEEYQAIMALILAHEMGHYFYESQIQNSQSGRSFLDQGSYVHSGPIPSDVKAKMHGEIDLIGLSLAKRAGFDVLVATKAIEYTDRALRKMTQNIFSLTEIEKTERLKLITGYLNGK